MGASSGNEDNLARLVRLRPSEAIDRTSKLPRRIECNDPRGASFAWGIVDRDCSLVLGTSNEMIKCVGFRPTQNTGVACKCIETVSRDFRLIGNTPSYSRWRLVCIAIGVTSVFKISPNGRPIISSSLMFKIRSMARLAYWARNRSSVIIMGSRDRWRAV